MLLSWPSRTPMHPVKYYVMHVALAAVNAESEANRLS